MARRLSVGGRSESGEPEPAHAEGPAGRVVNVHARADARALRLRAFVRRALRADGATRQLQRSDPRGIQAALARLRQSRAERGLRRLGCARSRTADVAVESLR